MIDQGRCSMPGCKAQTQVTTFRLMEIYIASSARIPNTKKKRLHSMCFEKIVIQSTEA